MYYPTTPAELWFFLIFLSAGFAFVFVVVGFVGYRAYDRGRTWKITVPPVPGQLAQIERVKPKRMTVTIPATGGEKELQILSPGASYPTTRGPLQLVTAWGANLVASSKDDFDALIMPTMPQDYKAKNEPPTNWEPGPKPKEEKVTEAEWKKAQWNLVS